MLQGTGSDVGKSLLVAGLARAFTRRGLRVRPFKPQNMSNNAAVTADGGEIGRAQALQARACGIAPVTDMNPVLLKPQSDGGAQIVLQGRVLARRGRASTARWRRACCRQCSAAFARLAEAADLVLVEGAGSPAEINLRARRHRQYGLCRGGRRAGRAGRRYRARRRHRPARRHARAAVGDRAGAARRLHRQQIPRRYPAVRRRHRGDRRQRTGLRCFGVVPFFPAAALCRRRIRWRLRRPSPTGRQPPSPAGGERAAERSEAGEGRHPDRRAAAAAHRQFRRSRSAARRARGRAGHGPAGAAAAARRRARHPAGLEGDARRSRRSAARGLGHRPPRASPPRRARPRPLRRLSDARPQHRRSARHRGRAGRRCPGSACSTSRPCSAGDKRLARSHRHRARDRHAGPRLRDASRRDDRAGPRRARCCASAGGPDGAVSADGRVTGCYLHGLFASDPFRRAFLARLGRASPAKSPTSTRSRPPSTRSPTISSDSLDLAALLAAARPPRLRRAA